MSTSQSPFTIRCESEDLQKDIDAIAMSMDRTRSWVINQALKDYVRLNKWQISAIEKGVESLDNGRHVSHESVMSRIENKLKKTCK